MYSGPDERPGSMLGHAHSFCGEGVQKKTCARATSKNKPQEAAVRKEDGERRENPSWCGRQGGWQGTTRARNSHQKGVEIGEKEAEGARERSPEEHGEREKEAEATEDSRKGSCDKVSAAFACEGSIPKGIVIHKPKFVTVKKIVDGKKASLKNTYRAQQEENDKSMGEERKHGMRSYKLV